MNKEGFLESLRRNLKNNPEKDIVEIIRDYEEHISIGLKNGREEAELIKSLGDPADIARQIKADYHIKKAETKTSAANIFRAIYASAGIGVLNLIFILPLLIALLFLLFLLFIIPLSFIMAGNMVLIACLASILIPDYFFGLSGAFISFPEAIGASFMSIGLVSTGWLILIGAFHATKFISELVLRYLKFNLSIIQNKEELI